MATASRIACGLLVIQAISERSNSRPSRLASLCPQSNHGVRLRGFLRGDVASEYSYGEHPESNHSERERIGRTDIVDQARQDAPHYQRQDDSYCRARKN